jgi:hypothetical protein
MIPDEFVPDSRVCREFNITPMTIWRWDRDPAKAQMGWPPPVRINKRKFRSRKQLEQFKNNLLQVALEARGQQASAQRCDIPSASPWPRMRRQKLSVSAARKSSKKSGASGLSPEKLVVAP